MVIKSRENSVSAWALLIGVLIAIIIGIGTSSLLPLSRIETYSAKIYAILVVLGIIIGSTIKISGKESETFLITGAILVIVSRFGMESVSGSLIGIGLGDVVSSTFSALLTILVPATIIVALKRVFSLSV